METVIDLAYVNDVILWDGDNLRQILSEQEPFMPSFETSRREIVIPSFIDIKKSVIEALKKFGNNDLNLLEYSIDEYAYPHHIACYLGEIFTKQFGYDVDCEYNKVGTTSEIKKESPYRIDTVASNKKGVRPDIIVHERGNPTGNNLLVIEIKKAENRNISRDRRKLKYFTNQDEQLRYKYGLLLLISPRDKTVRGEFFEMGLPSEDKKIDKFYLNR